jgi:hypothetical protein
MPISKPGVPWTNRNVLWKDDNKSEFAEGIINSCARSFVIRSESPPDPRLVRTTLLVPIGPLREGDLIVMAFVGSVLLSVIEGYLTLKL